MVAGLALVATLPATAARAFGWDGGPLLVVVALTPFVAILAVFGLAVAAASGGRVVIVVSLVVAVVQLAWLAPVYVSDGSSPEPAALTVATVNLRLGQGDVESVVASVREAGVDILSVQELAPQTAGELTAAGLGELLPYQVVSADSGGNGTGLWSRWPLEASQVAGDWFSPLIVATTVSDLGPITVVAPHPASPSLWDHELWASELGRLAELLAPLQGGVVVAGDLNATRDHAQVRRLEGLGYVDAPDAVGAGVRMTFPVGRRVPPVFAIDHVLTRDLDVVGVSFDVRDVPGSDHRLVIVAYARRV